MVWNRKHIKIKTDENWYYILGFFLGDGWFNINHTTSKAVVSFFLSENDDYEFLYNYFTQLGLTVQSKCPVNSKMVSLVINSMSLAKALEQYYPNNSTCYTKRIPEKVFTASLALRNAYLKGVLDSDGHCVSHKGTSNPVSITLANKQLIQELFILFHLSGIPATTYQTTENAWRLVLHRHYVFKYLNVSCESKFEKPRHSIKTPLHIQRPFYEKLKFEVKGDQDKALVSRLKLDKNVTPYTLKSLAEKYNVSLPVELFHYVPVKAVEVLDEVEDTYTLEVYDPSHRFDSELVISKNTSADITKLALSMIYEELYERGYHPTKSQDIKLILTVHDEIELESTEELKETARELLQRNMEEAGKAVLKLCPVEAEAGFGYSLADK